MNTARFVFVFVFFCLFVLQSLLLSTEDLCNYPDESELDEYILNTSGRIWVGSSRSNYGRPWQFSQFSNDCLEVALWLMEKMKPRDRGNPILVSGRLD